MERHTEAPFPDLKLHVFILNGTVLSYNYDKWDGFDVDIENCTLLLGDITQTLSY